MTWTVAISSGANASTRATLAIAEPPSRIAKSPLQKNYSTRSGNQLPLKTMGVRAIVDYYFLGSKNEPLEKSNRTFAEFCGLAREIGREPRKPAFCFSLLEPKVCIQLMVHTFHPKTICVHSSLPVAPCGSGSQCHARRVGWHALSLPQF